MCTIKVQKEWQTSSGSLYTVKFPSNSGLGVYSKSSTSADIISRLQIKNPCKQKPKQKMTMCKGMKIQPNLA